ncbi:MAG: hypothetical protein ABJC26_10690 [Gemmatimonadaceae bacterium]
MNESRAPALIAARHLWDRTAGITKEGNPESDLADLVLSAVATDLRRWVGAEGYSALQARATAMTINDHPVLKSISMLEIADRTAPNDQRYSSDDYANGVVALLATMMELLGRIIGSDMAVQLMKQITQPSPRGAVSSKVNDTRHD